MDDSKPKDKRQRPRLTPDAEKVKPTRNREAVLSDFRKVAGPLRGPNRDRIAKP